MRFISPLKNLRVVVDRKHYVRNHLGEVIDTTSGLAADFGLVGVFDSEVAQESLGWTNEQRETVEDFLVHRCKDRGKFYYVEDQPEVSAGPVQETVLNPCIGSVVVPGEPSQVCGKPALDGKDFCALHDPDREEVSV